MGFIEKIKSRIKYEFLKLVKPEIIGIKRDKNDHLIKDTRISNVTHISFPQNVRIGDNVFIGHFNYIDGYDGVIIGEGCQITNYVSILSHSSHHAIRLYGDKYLSYWGTKMKGLRWGRVEIGEYTFIGPHSVVMPGSVIGKGCIIAAYAFVDGKVEDYSIMRGNPAERVGDTRKSDEDLLIKFPELNEFYYQNREKHVVNP